MLLCSESISEELRQNTLKCLHSLYIDNFAAGLMWVMKEVFGLEDSRMLCAPNERHGHFILNEIMKAGNMGHYDERLVSIRNASKFKRFIIMNFHTLRLFRYYPYETFFTPFAKIWIWGWRKAHGYL